MNDETLEIRTQLARLHRVFLFRPKDIKLNRDGRLSLFQKNIIARWESSGLLFFAVMLIVPTVILMSLQVNADKPFGWLIYPALGALSLGFLFLILGMFDRLTKAVTSRFKKPLNVRDKILVGCREDVGKNDEGQKSDPIHFLKLDRGELEFTLTQKQFRLLQDLPFQHYEINYVRGSDSEPPVLLTIWPSKEEVAAAGEEIGLEGGAGQNLFSSFVDFFLVVLVYLGNAIVGLMITIGGMLLFVFGAEKALQILNSLI